MPLQGPSGENSPRNGGVDFSLRIVGSWWCIIIITDGSGTDGRELNSKSLRTHLLMLVNYVSINDDILFPDGGEHSRFRHVDVDNKQNLTKTLIRYPRGENTIFAGCSSTRTFTGREKGRVSSFKFE